MTATAIARDGDGDRGRGWGWGGRGGHTSEMLKLTQNLSRTRYHPVYYVIAATDNRSEPRVKASPVRCFAPQIPCIRASPKPLLIRMFGDNSQHSPRRRRHGAVVAIGRS